MKWRSNLSQSDHAFSPTEVDAQIGDIIRYSFFPENHSVARAEYDAPCQPIEYGRIGFPPLFSGFHPVEAGKTVRGCFVELVI